jgi:uncharacterized protein (TIGR02996 family)
MSKENDMQKLFDKALYENFDDIATHSAYADWLIDQKDPRGELMRVQLALENEQLPKKERNRLKKEEKELLSQMERELFNQLTKLSEYERQYLAKTIRFQRGWVVEIRSGVINPTIAESLHSEPFRFLQSLRIGEGGYDNEFKILKAAPFLPTLKRFEVGLSPNKTYVLGEQIADFLKPCKQLQYLELNAHRLKTKKLFTHFFPELNSLEINCTTEYPLEVLSQNPSLTKLQRLSLFPHSGRDESTLGIDHLRAIVESLYLKKIRNLIWNSSNIGDEGCQVLVESGFLKQLKILDLSYGRITDQGVRILISSPDFKQLLMIDLSENALTSKGIQALESTGVNYKGRSNQHAIEDDYYLYAGDME